MNISRKAKDYIFPDRYTSFTHAKPNICSIRNPLVVIIVCSDTQNVKLRKAIRETWAAESERFNITVLFLVGISKDENVNVSLNLLSER